MKSYVATALHIAIVCLLFGSALATWSHRPMQLQWDNFHGSIAQRPHFFAIFYDSQDPEAEKHLSELDAAISLLWDKSPQAWDYFAVGALDIAPHTQSVTKLAGYRPQIAWPPSGSASFKYLDKEKNKWAGSNRLGRDDLFQFISKRLGKYATPVDPASTVPIPKGEQEMLPAHLRSLQTLEVPHQEYHRIHKMARLLQQDPSTAVRTLENVHSWQANIAAHAQYGPLFAERTAAFVRLFGKVAKFGPTFPDKEMARLSRILRPNGDDSPAPVASTPAMARIEMQIELLRSFRETIPRILHFIKTDKNPDMFLLIHYISIRSAAHKIRPDRIKFHCMVEPAGHYWDKLRADVPQLEVVIGAPTQTVWNGHTLVHPAHLSDSWRIEILIREGGIYLDWDVLMLKPIDDLLDAGLVFGAEKKIPDMAEVLGVAVMMSRPNDPFLKRWIAEIDRSFDPTCYACHSILLARNLALHHPYEVTVLPWKAFYFPGWEKQGADFVWQPVPKGSLSMATVQDAFAESYGVHLIESHENIKPRITALNEKMIKEVDAAFHLLVRDYFAN